MNGRQMRSRCGRKLGDQLFDPSVFCNTLDKWRVLKALKESPAKRIYKKQDDGIIVAGYKRTFDTFWDPYKASLIIARLDELWIHLFLQSLSGLACKIIWMMR